jgi:hypothetical protein
MAPMLMSTLTARSAVRNGSLASRAAIADVIHSRACAMTKYNRLALLMGSSKVIVPVK